MPEVRLRHFLPALMGSLHQQRAEGELVLEQNDGTRRLYWAGGDLRYMRSDAVGEQFGNFLVRRGVLDMAALRELLAEGEGARVGDRVVQLGLLTVPERDERLRELLGSVLLHAMEHPILRLAWNPGPLGDGFGSDLRFGLDHRVLVWDTFQRAKVELDLMEMFQAEPQWRWEARPDLLEALSDLPLTPALAYALTLLGSEPLGYETIGALTGFPREETARLVATLWALGGLTLVCGDLPLAQTEQPPPAVEVLEPEPEFDPGPEPEIALVEDDPEPGAAQEHPLTLMDILDMDAGWPEPASTIVPPSGGDPFLRTTPRSPLSFPASEVPEPPPRGFVPGPPLPSAPEFPAPPESAFSPDPFRHDPMAHTPVRPSSLPESEDLPPVRRAQQLLTQAKTYLAHGRASEAARALEQAIKLDGDSPGAYEAWLLLGRLRLANPAWSTRAVEALQVASRLNPRTAEPWVLMGELYLRKGYHANARGCFRRALELDPSVALPSGYQEEDLSLSPRDEAPGFMDRLRAALGRGKV